MKAAAITLMVLLALQPQVPTVIATVLLSPSFVATAKTWSARPDFPLNSTAPAPQPGPESASAKLDAAISSTPETTFFIVVSPYRSMILTRQDRDRMLRQSV